MLGEPRQQVRAIALDQRPAELVQAVEAIRDRVDLTDVLEGLGDRALALIGDADPFVSGHEVPAHEVVVLPNCGHLPSMQRAAEFNELVVARLAEWT